LPVTQVFDSARDTIIFGLNRPEKLNALTYEMIKKLSGCISDASADDRIRCIVITGEGRAFCAGSDLGARLTGGHRQGSVKGDAYLLALRELNREISDVRTPVIAAVNGHAIGGGLEIALACDIRIVAKSAKLGLGEVKVGAMAGGGGTQRLPRIIGMGRALEMMFTGEPVTGERAAQIGLANRAVDEKEVLNCSLDLAAIIAKNAPLSLEAIKRACYKGIDLGIESALDVELFYADKIAKTSDRDEGMRAFIEKRPPCFRGE
jgi:enoyl-CoA hydratase/carnithine racemase